MHKHRGWGPLVPQVALRCAPLLSTPLPSLCSGPSSASGSFPERWPPQAQVPCAGSQGPQRLGEELAAALGGGASLVGSRPTCPQPRVCLQDAEERKAEEPDAPVEQKGRVGASKPLPQHGLRGLRPEPLAGGR